MIGSKEQPTRVRRKERQPKMRIQFQLGRLVPSFIFARLSGVNNIIITAIKRHNE
jgi:hypothetical protein